MKNFCDHVREAYTPPITKNEEYVLCTCDFCVARAAEIEHPGSHIRTVRFKHNTAKYFLIKPLITKK